MILYSPLWETMKARGFTQYRLKTYYNISSGQISRLKKNSNVSTHTLDMLCSILNCRIEDIVKHQYDPSQDQEFGIPVTPDFPEETDEAKP